MKSELIMTGVPHLEYPVGENISTNLPYIKGMVKALLTLKLPFEKGINLICRGSSGAIIAAIFASELGKIRTRIVHVKKEGEESHGGTTADLNHSALNVIVDDFICSGETLNKIYEHFKKYNPDKEIDVVCVTGRHKELAFEPKYFLFGQRA